MADVEVEAVFYHPYSRGAATGEWSHGFFLRVRKDYSCMLAYEATVTGPSSGGHWRRGTIILHEGEIQGLFETGNDKPMHLRVVLIGDTLELYVNNVRETPTFEPMKLDAQDGMSGTIGIGTGMFQYTSVGWGSDAV